MPFGRTFRAFLASPHAAEIIRYLLGGGGITLATYFIYLAGLEAGMASQVSWAASFACGVVMGYVVHGRYVFRAEARRHHWVTFPLSYLLRFALGELILWLGLQFGMTPAGAGLVTNVAMAPLGFLLLRLVLKGEALTLAEPAEVAPRAGVGEAAHSRTQADMRERHDFSC